MAWDDNKQRERWQNRETKRKENYDAIDFIFESFTGTTHHSMESSEKAARNKCEEVILATDGWMPSSDGMNRKAAAKREKRARQEALRQKKLEKQRLEEARAEQNKDWGDW